MNDHGDNLKGGGGSSSKVESSFSNEVCNEHFAHQFKNHKRDSYLVLNGNFEGEVHPNQIDDTEKN